MKGNLDFLIKQFTEALNIKNGDIDSKAFRHELFAWLKYRQSIGSDYINFLEYMGLNQISSPDAAEVGKSAYDSIVGDLDETMIITPYSNYFFGVDKRRIINGDFKVEKDVPFLVAHNTIIPVDSETPITFMTHNPYKKESINNWEQLHNSGNHNIVVGVYGNIHDKDINEKIKQIAQLKDKLSDYFYSYIEEQGVVDETYCYAVASKRKVKTLSLRKTR